jgi:hypothetical protein
MNCDLLLSKGLCLICILLTTSCGKEQIASNNIPKDLTTTYTIDNTDHALWKTSRAIFENEEKNTINIYIDAGVEEQRIHTISLKQIVLEEGIQELSGVFKLGSSAEDRPTVNFTTSFHNGVDIVVEDWYFTDTTLKDNWVNILTYDKDDNYVRGTFQFTAIRDSRFTSSGALPDVIVIQEGYFETFVNN